MNVNTLRKTINEAYLDYYGSNISNLCIDRIINHYKKLTKDNNMRANGQLPNLYKREEIRKQTEADKVKAEGRG